MVHARQLIARYPVQPELTLKSSGERQLTAGRNLEPDSQQTAPIETWSPTVHLRPGAKQFGLAFFPAGPQGTNGKPARVTAAGVEAWQKLFKGYRETSACPLFLPGFCQRSLPRNSRRHHCGSPAMR